MTDQIIKKILLKFQKALFRRLTEYVTNVLLNKTLTISEKKKGKYLSKLLQDFLNLLPLRAHLDRKFEKKILFLLHRTRNRTSEMPKNPKRPLRQRDPGSNFLKSITFDFSN